MLLMSCQLAKLPPPAWQASLELTGQHCCAYQAYRRGAGVGRGRGVGRVRGATTSN